MTDDSLRILIVEDSAADAELMIGALQAEGLVAHFNRVETAAEIVHALEFAHYDLVLADNRLPTLDGAEIVALIRNGGRDVPVIIVSGTIGEEQAAALMKAGASDFINKANLARLAPAIEREIRESRDRSARRALEAEVWRLAYFDAVTDLPNRNLLSDRITRDLATGRPVAVIYLELHRFPEIRNTLGCRQLDEVLRFAARRLAAIPSPEITLAHIAPDTFALSCPRTDAADAASLAGRLLATLIDPGTDGVLRMCLGGAAGIAVSPDHGETADALIRRAGIAAEAARLAGTPVELYDLDADVFTARRLDLINDLWTAADRGEFELHFQPQVNLRQRKTVGVEALLRWRRPGTGSGSPEMFIPIAEQSGSIRPITTWVLGRALQECAAWRKRGISPRVSVNVSGVSLLDAAFTRLVSDQLAKFDLPSAALALEITEGALMRDPRGARTTLEQLRDLGVRVVIDDYGAGYSSLSYLKHLPVSALKIDKSFLRGDFYDQRDVSIVRSTIGLAHNLGVSVVAEGIEHGATLERLERLGCDEGQGFHIARPMPAADLGHWLKSSIWPA